MGSRPFEHAIAHPDAIEHVKDVWAELDPVANGAGRRRAFQYSRRLSMTREPECSRQPPEPAADNEDRALSTHIALWSSSLSSAASPQIRFLLSLNEAANWDAMEANYSVAQDAAECLLLTLNSP